MALLAGCGSSGGSTKADPDKPVTIAFWSGAKGTQTVVEKWNKENPDIQVKWSDAPGSWGDQAAKLTASIKAGQAPCLAIMQNDYIPSLAVSGSLEDVTKDTKQYKSDYYPSTWSTVTFAGKTYGLPQGIGPMALFYRADKFKELGISVPATWDEFAKDAEIVAQKAPGTYLTGLAGDDAQGFVSLVAQRSKPFFSISGDSWKVNIDNSDARDVAAYWQRLMDKGLLNTTNRWDPTFYNDLSEGKQLTVIGGAWQASLIASNVKGGAGHWAVAPMPNWTKAKAVSAPNGGGALIAIKGCPYPAQTMKFAHYVTSNLDALTESGTFPAVANEKIPTPAAVKSFFGGQDVNGELTKISATVPAWPWSPTWNDAQPLLSDSMAAFKDKKGTLAGLLTSLEKEQVSSMKAAGISVSGS